MCMTKIYAQREKHRKAVVQSNTLGWGSFAIITIASCAALFLVIFLTGGPKGIGAASFSTHDDEQARFVMCSGPVRTNCVVDGDTIWYAGRKIRIADINTPEIDNAKCNAERTMGGKAKYRLHALLNQGAFSLASIDRDQDKHGRDLRIITRDGVSIGDTLVDEGLAEIWGGDRINWC